MYILQRQTKSLIKRSKFYKGETMEEELRRALSNETPIRGGAAIAYSERKDGVLAAFDIRTDKVAVMTKGMHYVANTYQNVRDQSIAEKALKGMIAEGEAGEQPAQTGGQE